MARKILDMNNFRIMFSIHKYISETRVQHVVRTEETSEAQNLILSKYFSKPILVYNNTLI